MSAEAHATSAPVTVEPFRGGGQTMMVAGAIGVLGLLITVAMMFIGGEDGQRQAFASYLLGFSYWCGISMAALILLCAFHAAKAKWMTVLRRALEVMAASVVIFAVLFIPIALGANKLYVWWDFDAFTSTLKGHELHAMHVKHAWFSHGFFLLRQVIYFVSFIAVSHIALAWSRGMDDGKSPLVLKKLRVLGPVALPLLALCITFAAVDWLMTLEPLFFSTIWGVYYFAGSFLACIAVWTQATINSQVVGGYGALATKAHWHGLGKLLLAFVAFWAYIAMSQLLLIWIANLPEEVPFYIRRWAGGWKFWSLALLIGHFIIPFLLLLQRQAKMNKTFLMVMTLYILTIHFIDLYWLIMPVFRPESPMPRLTDITAFAGVGGLSIAFAIWRVRGTYSVPVADPFLPYSLKYVQPL